MLLNKLAPFYGINSVLSDRSKSLIQHFNDQLTYGSHNEDSIKDILHKIFLEIVHPNVDSFY